MEESIQKLRISNSQTSSHSVAKVAPSVPMQNSYIKRESCLNCPSSSIRQQKGRFIDEKKYEPQLDSSDGGSSGKTVQLKYDPRRVKKDVLYKPLFRTFRTILRDLMNMFLSRGSLANLSKLPLR